MVKEKKRKVYLVVSHLPVAVRYLCVRSIFITEGIVCASLPLEVLQQQPSSHRSRLLDSN
jgi:ABC-type dipeptide/oligopeptide/nickel transport system ATPase subunit